MVDASPDPPGDAAGNDPPEPTATARATGAILLAGAGGLLWAIARYQLPAEAHSAGASPWLTLLWQIVRDTLQAVGLILAATGAAMLCCRPVVRVERWVYGCDRRWFLLILAIAAALLSAGFSYRVLDHTAHIPDEVAMLFQAKNLALGQFYAPAPPEGLRPFFDCEFVAVDGERWYGRYFAGPSLLFVPALWVGAPWIVNPILGGLTILLFYGLGKELFNERMGRLAALLGVISPFHIVNSAWMMSHEGCLFLITLMSWSLLKALRDPRRYKWWVISSGAMGMALHYRPLTLVAVGVPLAVAGVAMCRWRQVTVGSVVAFALPLAGFVGLFLAYNHAVTGDAMTAPFNQWSKSERLGFGPDVGLDYWPAPGKSGGGAGHDLSNALNNTRLNIDALGVTLLGWGRGSLILLVTALLLGRRRWAFGLALAVLLAPQIAYFFYYASGRVFGIPRYSAESMGFTFALAVGGLAGLRVLIARGYRLFGWPNGGAHARAALWVAALLLTLSSAWDVMPQLADESGLGSRFVVPQLAETVEAEGVHNALVLVPSGWYRERVHFLFQPVRMLETIDRFGTVMLLTSPNLDGDVVYARDRGDEANSVLLEHFPGRKAYRFVEDPFSGPRLQPVSAAAAQ